MSELTRKFEVYPAYDKRGEGYGQHCVTMRWLVIGPKGAIQFVLYTGWYPDVIPQTRWDDWSDWETLHVKHEASSSDLPMPCDLGYHSYVPHYEGQKPLTSHCHVLGDKPCFYDGSSLNAAKPFSILVHEGGEKLWEFLENYYRETFPSEAA